MKNEAIGDGADTAEQMASICRLACSRYCFVLDSNAFGQRDKWSARQLQGLLESGVGTRIAAVAVIRNTCQICSSIQTIDPRIDRQCRVRSASILTSV